jgi:GTPase SAR1 family protein
MEVDGELYTIELMDPSGTVRSLYTLALWCMSIEASEGEFVQESSTSVRDMCMKNGHGFVLMYAIVDESTFDEVQRLRDQVLSMKNMEMVRDRRYSLHNVHTYTHRRPAQATLVLVGDKSKQEGQWRVVSKQRGAAMAQNFGCAFLEISTTTGAGVDDVFHTLLRQIIAQNQLDKNPTDKKHGKSKKDKK